MNFLRGTIMVAVIVFLVAAQGVNGNFSCTHCAEWEIEANCTTVAQCDEATSCIVAKAMDGGQVKYKKGCSTGQDCNDVLSLCGRTAGGIICLAGGCCNSSSCSPSKLKVIPMPSSSVKLSSIYSKLISSSVNQMAMKSSDVLAPPSPMSSSARLLQTTEAVASEVPAATTTTKPKALKTTIMHASSKKVIARATETSMKDMMGSPYVKISEALASASRSPNQGRPTCKDDSSGMRHVLNPLTIVFVVAGLVNIFL